MKISKNQAGVGHLVLILGVLIVAAIGGVGYKVYQDNQDTTEKTTTAEVIKESSDEINSQADVEKASTELDATSVDDSSIDSLDSDINAVL